jgi:hypothetical protein
MELDLPYVLRMLARAQGIINANEPPLTHPFLVDTDTSTVVLDADNILLNGSVKATKMDVAELSAITANLGAVTAGSLTSTNGKWVQDLDGGTAFQRCLDRVHAYIDCADFLRQGPGNSRFADPRQS